MPSLSTFRANIFFHCCKALAEMCPTSQSMVERPAPLSPAEFICSRSAPPLAAAYVKEICLKSEHLPKIMQYNYVPP